jgi:hypothetical protein
MVHEGQEFMVGGTSDQIHTENKREHANELSTAKQATTLAFDTVP